MSKIIELNIVDKEGKEQRPDYTGSAKVDGVNYRVASWINTTQDGKEYLSLKFELQEETNNNPFWR